MPGAYAPGTLLMHRENDMKFEIPKLDSLQRPLSCDEVLKSTVAWEIGEWPRDLMPLALPRKGRELTKTKRGRKNFYCIKRLRTQTCHAYLGCGMISTAEREIKDQGGCRKKDGCLKQESQWDDISGNEEGSRRNKALEERKEKLSEFKRKDEKTKWN